MRYGLLSWSLLSALASTLASLESTDQPLEEDSQVEFYEPGTDIFNIPELYRPDTKAGQEEGNTTGVYMGPTFKLEFQKSPLTERCQQTKFKLLDWKKRRRREELNGTITVVNVTENANLTNYIQENPCQESPCQESPCQYVGEANSGNKSLSENCYYTDKSPLSMSNLIGKNESVMLKDSNEEVESKSLERFGMDSGTDKLLKVYTQPDDYVDDAIQLSASGSLKDQKRMVKNCSGPSYPQFQNVSSSFDSITVDSSSIKGDSLSFNNNRVRRDDAPLKGLIEYSQAEDEFEQPDKVIDTVSSLAREKSPYVQTNKSGNSSNPYTSHLLQTPKYKQIIDYEETLTQDMTSEPITVTSEETSDTKPPAVNKPKAKILINGNVMSPQTILSTTVESISLFTTISCSYNTPTPVFDCRKMECHPKGTGPLHPISYLQDSTGPNMEEEEEDALTGKLADRVVEVVMARVGKCPRMSKELGLCAQGNLTQLQECVKHPDSKETCQAQTSESLKCSVLQEITQAVEKLANTKGSGACLKPPPDLLEFLCWLLSEDYEMDMPEPTCNVKVQPRREADYLFRSNRTVVQSCEEANDSEYFNHNYNSSGYFEEMGEDAEEVADNTSEIASENYVTVCTGASREIRSNHGKPHMRRKRCRKLPDKNRRRRYTPWSLCDYP